LAFAASLAVGALVVWAVRPVPEVTWQGPGFVAQGRARVEPHDGLVAVRAGTLGISTWGQPGVRLEVAGHLLEAQASLFAVQVAGDSVVLDVREGLVLVDGERVERRWPASAEGLALDFSGVQRLEPAQAREEREWRISQALLEAGQVEAARAQLARLAGGGLRAEAALLLKGELELRRLHDAKTALGTLDDAARRFPEGSLQQEVALTRLEALHALGDTAALGAAARDFLTRFPQSERRAEVERLAAP
jgi:hypothetical protein